MCTITQLFGFQWNSFGQILVIAVLKEKKKDLEGFTKSHLVFLKIWLH